MYRVLDLFAGAGGMSLGFEQTGKYRIAVAVEKQPSAQATYRFNHKHAEVLEDILDIEDYAEFERRFGKFDVVIGGPPCQGFSNANRQRNHVISKNNSLVKKYVEVIESLKPQAFVLENVRMLQSSTHRFYKSFEDQVQINELNISMRNETICMFSGDCPVEGIEQYLIDRSTVCELLFPERDLQALRILLKNSYREGKRDKVLKANGKANIKKIHTLLARNASLNCNNRFEEPDHCIKNIITEMNDIGVPKPSYQQFEKEALLAILDYLEMRVPFEEVAIKMSAVLHIQRLLSSMKELLDNNVIVECLRISKSGVFVDVQSFPVIDYIIKKLERHYNIDAGILNAAWFGAPQLRERFIALGIRRDLVQGKSIEVSLPAATYNVEQYHTVWDAIGDLEGINPKLSVDELPVDLSSVARIATRLTHYLRDSDTLFNHVIPETREIARKRFEALKPGQNFHDLDARLIENTYSRPERTQNSIYLRLEYSRPSGTVTNIRKSMWIHPELNRGVSIREAARLQTFPDSFVFIGSKDSQYQQIGNAVPPLMATAIADKVATLLEAGNVGDLGGAHMGSRLVPSARVERSKESKVVREEVFT